MFEKSSTWSRLSDSKPSTINVHLGHVPYLEEDRDDESKRRWIAIGIAVVLHLGFFLIQLPAFEARPLRPGVAKQVFVVQQVRFKPPPPRPAKQLPQRTEKRRIIPIPDPTPDEPEPIRVAELEVPDYDVIGDSVVFGISEGPPGPGLVGSGPLRLDGNITPPRKLFFSRPRYTEEGRQERVQGVVILEAIIDKLGNVTDVKVLKGLPNGLSASAVEAAEQWKYEPAKLDGEPVAVFLNLQIRFSLQ